MKNKLLYGLFLLLIVIVLLIIINFIDIINIKNEKNSKLLENAIRVLNIELSNSDLSIVRGEKFNIEYDKKIVEVIYKDNGIDIKEISNKLDKIIVTLPENFKFNQLNIISDKGNININNVNSDFFYINSKSGKINVDNLSVTNKTDVLINSSKMLFKNSEIHNVDLFMDDGEFVYDGVLGGRNEINTSRGNIEINIKDKLDNYRIEIVDDNKNIKVNKRIINNKSYTKGKKAIIINGKGTLNINGDESNEKKK